MIRCTSLNSPVHVAVRIIGFSIPLGTGVNARVLHECANHDHDFGRRSMAHARSARYDTTGAWCIRCDDTCPVPLLLPPIPSLRLFQGEDGEEGQWAPARPHSTDPPARWLGVTSGGYSRRLTLGPMPW